MRSWLPIAVLFVLISPTPVISTPGQTPDSNPSVPVVEGEVLEGVRFYPGDGTLYVSPEAVASRLRLDYQRDPSAGASGTGSLSLAGSNLPVRDVRTLPDGGVVVPIRDLANGDTPTRTVEWDAAEQRARIRTEEAEVTVRAGWKSVVAGISFARRRERLWAPEGELRSALALPDKPPAGTGDSEGRRLLTGAPIELVPIERLPWSDVRVEPATAGAAVHLLHDGREAWVVEGDKRVAISLNAQKLRAWQGERLVLETHVSTGRRGHRTPRGSFRAGPLKARLMISHKYNDAPMPWSVQVRGDVMIHGFPSVPPQPASHGCIRVPLSGANPARWFYHWVTIGTPIAIERDWPETTVDSNGSGGPE